MIEIVVYVRKTGEVRLRFGNVEAGDPSEALVRTTVGDMRDLFKRIEKLDSTTARPPQKFSPRDTNSPSGDRGKPLLGSGNSR